MPQTADTQHRLSKPDSTYHSNSDRMKHIKGEDKSDKNETFETVTIHNAEFSNNVDEIPLNNIQQPSSKFIEEHYQLKTEKIKLENEKSEFEANRAAFEYIQNIERKSIESTKISLLQSANYWRAFEAEFIKKRANFEKQKQDYAIQTANVEQTYNKQRKEIKQNGQLLTQLQTQIQDLQNEKKTFETEKAILAKERANLQQELNAFEQTKIRVLKLNADIKKQKMKFQNEKINFEIERKEKLEEELAYKSLQDRVDCKIVWEYKDNKGKWIEYDEKTSHIIEDLNDKSQQQCNADHSEHTFQICKKSSNSAILKNVITSETNEIRRSEWVTRLKAVKALTEKKIVIWEWNDLGKWYPYDHEISKRIDALSINDSYVWYYRSNDQHYKITKRSDISAWQTNINTHVKRNVRRTEFISSFDTAYPRYWDKNYTNYANPKLISIDLCTTVGVEIVNNFCKTLGNKYIVTEIRAIQNQMLYDSYYNARKQLSRLIGKQNINEMDLYHGTSTDVMIKIVIEGFRKEFNTTAQYGNGTYFARDARYSDGYAKTDNNGMRKMFQCKVLAGQSAQGDRKYNLKNWPKKSNGLIFDSLVDNIVNPEVFAIHENVRAYPMFIIHYK
eukprot:484348_1